MEFVSWDDDIPIVYGKNHQAMFQTTKQSIFLTHRIHVWYIC